jgi:hypothetical protein
VARHRRAVGLVPILLLAVCAVVAAQIVNFGHTTAHRSNTATSDAAAFDRAAQRPGATTTTTTASTVPPTTTTTSTTVPPAPPPAPVPTTTTTVPPAPPMPVAPPAAPGIAPPRGQASAWGCAAAVAYLSAYAYPGFTFECPGNALGREGMTCVNAAGVCPGESIIAIADACPAAYMNEASNSWVMEGQSTAPIDPYGAC